MAAGATSPDGISFITTGSSIDPVAESANQASSIQAALNLRPYYQYVWPTASTRTSQTGMRQGDLGFEVDTTTPYQYISAAAGWQPLPFGASRVLAGSVAITPSGSAGSYTGSSAVTFPTGFFSSTPNVLTNPSTSVPGKVNSSAASTTATGFTVQLSRTDNATLTAVFWMAIL